MRKKKDLPGLVQINLWSLPVHTKDKHKEKYIY